MFLESLTKLLAVLMWPTVVLVIAILLRAEIRGLFGRVRAIEAPGDFKFTLDPNEVGKILDDASKEHASTATVAERIARTARILDSREARILRALVDDDGRAMYSYRTDYYKPALEGTIKKGLVRQEAKGFALTDKGLNAVRDYLMAVLAKP